ncbi:UNVERIFIED_CONTAM: hypothetical protein HDU68_004229 [Siphonaria sp. JEL0065]|nr:hypothetical protein HDU68_004229 [Siphonaria sp. JEL0065]
MSRNIKTLGDLNGGNGNDGDSSDDEKHQEFFTGGEKSGTAVQGPRLDNQGRSNPAALIKDILGKAARGSGEAKGEPKKPAAFTGSGYRLGAENEPAAPPAATPTTQPTQPEPELELVTRHLTFWSDGFTVENGPLLRYDDPANQEILQAINSGRAPVQLLNVLPGQQVDVRVAHLHENWSEAGAKKLADSIAAAGPQKPAGTQAFTGAGRRLGGDSDSAPPAYSSSSFPGAFPSSSSSSASSAPVTTTAPSFTLDTSLPTTSLQIRLADGTRMVAKMNHSHTVGDVRRFINASRVGESLRPYAIMTTFPNKDLTDDSVTLKDAGLINAVIVQRLL